MDEAITGRGATRAKDLFASLDDEGDADETGAVRSADRARVSIVDLAISFSTFIASAEA